MPSSRGVYVRGGAPRVLRSPMTGAWYVVTSYYDRGGGRFEATAKRKVHPDDVAGLEAAYQCHKDWESGALVEAPVCRCGKVGCLPHLHDSADGRCQHHAHDIPVRIDLSDSEVPTASGDPMGATYPGQGGGDDWG